MAYAVFKSMAPFTLHVRCENCKRESQTKVDVPDNDEVPSDPDELIEGGYFECSPFSCRHCDSVIGRITRITGGSSHV